MAKNIDLGNLKKEIDARKQQRGVGGNTSSTTGMVAPRDGFLNDLLISLKEGRQTSATNLIKLVENKAAVRQGEKQVHTNVSERVQLPPQSTPPSTQHAPTVNMGAMPERDDKFFQDMDNMRKQTLAESIEQFQGKRVAPQQQHAQPNHLLTEGYLVEGVQKIVDNYLVENFTPIVEEAIKSTILELYATERIKEVLQENSEIIKKVVLETIRELQAKSKKKAE